MKRYIHKKSKLEVVEVTEGSYKDNYKFIKNNNYRR